MPNYDYFIIGGGMAADAAVRGIREIDSSGSIGLLSSEAYLPYDRPPLSKALWKGASLDEIRRETEELGIEPYLERSAIRIDPLRKTVEDIAGDVYRYGKLLLATGGTPRKLPTRDDGVIYFRELADYRKLRELTGNLSRVAVIGGGYIGAEIAAALRMNGHHVEMVFPEPTLLARILPNTLAQHVTSFYQDKGVSLHPSSLVEEVVRAGDHYRLSVSGGARLEADVVVAGLGLVPNTEIAEAAGLDVADGITVNHYLQTSNDHIFAAGDVASIFDPVLERRIRSEHEDNANSTGMHAGMAMAGRLEPYRHLPLFYSDLFELGFEGVGQTDAAMKVITDWTVPNEEGVIYYLAGRRVEGVLLWNSWGKVDAARELIESRRPIEVGEMPQLLAEA